jgi:1-acyl-sn-glycerol-3-phosphate acyltransferase
MQLLRSLIFTAYMMISAMLVGGFMALCFWLPYHAHFAMARAWARGVFYVLDKVCHLTWIVEGREHIPAGNHIVMSNHTSAWETIAQFMIFPPQVWVLKRELLWIPLLGWGLWLLKPISINRGAGRQAVAQVLEQGRLRLAAGLWIIIFPEGTRVLPGETKRYGASGALLARAADCYIVPLAHNAQEFWIRRGILKKPGRVRVVIGAPIAAQGREPEALNAEVRSSIDAGLRHIAATTV